MQHLPPTSSRRSSSSATAPIEGEPAPQPGKRFPFTARRTTPRKRQGRKGQPLRGIFRWFQQNSFAPEWFPARWQHPAFGYAAALITQLIAVLLDILLTAMLPTPPFRSLLPILGVLIVALGWGAAPAIVSLILGALLLDFFLLTPQFAILSGPPGSIASIVLLVLVGLTIIVLTNMTERARRTAAAERANLESIFESITDGMFVANAQGQLLRTNSAFREMFGLESDPEYANRPTEERFHLLNPRDEQGHPFTFEDWPISRLLRGETIGSKDAVEFHVQSLDGRQLFLSATGAPLRNRLEQVSGGVLIMRDITERKALERRTREALEALLAMAESLVLAPSASGPLKPSPTAAPNETAQRLVELTRRVLGCRRVGIVAIDPDTELQLPVAVVGLLPEEELFWWNEQGKIPLTAGPDPTFATSMRAGELVIIDTSQPPHNDQPNPYGIRSVLAAPMRMGEHLVGILGLDYGKEAHEFTRDEIALTRAVSKLGAFVLERARLLREREEARANELALREANRRMDEFLSIASHELKTPLTSIRTSIQLLQKRLRASRDAETAENESILRNIRSFEEMLARADRQAGQLNRLVDDLLDVSRIQTDRLDLYLQPADLAAIVRETVQQHALLVPRRTLALFIEAPAPVPIRADTDRIAQVLINYLTNALKYSPETEPVEIGLEVHKRRARVWVRDHGLGLPLAEQEHIWERFHRAKGIKVQSGSGVGLGIGLFISRTIIELHHGQVGVQSTPGQGATFWFSLPLSEK